jgi:hypothetical protein
VFVVSKLDRLGRDLRHLVNTAQDLAERAIGFQVLAGQGAEIDTTTASGKLVFGIFAALAAFETAMSGRVASCASTENASSDSPTTARIDRPRNRPAARWRHTLS